jgi:hypothetical protein
VSIGCATRGGAARWHRRQEQGPQGTPLPHLQLDWLGTGGKNKDHWAHDLWNIKYLSKFKWQDLTAQIGEHRLAL